MHDKYIMTILFRIENEIFNKPKKKFLLSEKGVVGEWNENELT